jgi:hypothetical protein
VLQLGVIAGGAVSLTNGGNSLGTLAGFTDGTTAGFSFTNGAALTIGTMPLSQSQRGVTVDGTNGTVSSAVMATGVGKPSNPLAGLTTTGDIALTTTGGTSNNITISSAIDAPGRNVTLVSVGGITETPGIISATLAITAVGPVSMADPNQVGTLAASVTGAGNSFLFRNDSLDLAIGTVGAVVGITTNGGAITLETTNSGNLALSQAVSTGSSAVSTVTLTSAGTISGNGAITAGTLTGSSGGNASILGLNAVGTLGSFTSGGNFDFRTTTALAETGPVTASGALSVEAIGGALTLSGSLTSSGPVGITSDNSTIAQTAGIISGTTLFGSSNGATTLNDANLLTNLGPFANVGAGGFALTNAQTLTVTGALDAGTGALGLTTTAGNLALGAGLTAGTTVTLTSAGDDQSDGRGHHGGDTDREFDRWREPRRR